MLSRGLDQFSGKNVILLQGPVGPFFSHFAESLRKIGAKVFKVNLNAGDWIFYPKNAFNYRGTMEHWEVWFQELTTRLNVDVIFLFGDCRPIHRIALKVAKKFNYDVGVFEEGYIRPNYVTLERFGVNNYSQLPKDPNYYRHHPPYILNEIELGRTYWYMVWCGFRYFTAGAIGKPFFPHYRHHRPLTINEGIPWLRSVFRKYWYQLTERGIQNKLIDQYKNKYFLVPLQVFNDAQITEHSNLVSIEDFINTILVSFVKNAHNENILVFKHHPMDRGYRDYSSLIKKLSTKFKCKERVLYIHDQHLPTLLNNARGVIVVNSTVGLSALHHSVMVKVYGSAIYDLPGLTYQNSLDAFWLASSDAKPDPELYSAYHSHVIAMTQLNGSFYKPLRIKNAVGGLVWVKNTESNLIEKTKICYSKNIIDEI